MSRNILPALMLPFLWCFQAAQAMEVDPKCDGKHIKAFAKFGKCVMKENVTSFGFRGDGVTDYSKCEAKLDKTFGKELAKAEGKGMTCTVTDAESTKSHWISMQEDLYQHFSSNDPLDPLP